MKYWGSWEVSWFPRKSFQPHRPPAPPPPLSYHCLSTPTCWKAKHPFDIIKPFMQKRSQEPLFPTEQHFLEHEDQWCWWTVDKVLPINPLNRMWNWNCGQKPHPEVARSQESQESEKATFFVLSHSQHQGGPGRGQGRLRDVFSKNAFLIFPNLLAKRVIHSYSYPLPENFGLSSFWARYILFYLASLKTCIREHAEYLY